MGLFGFLKKKVDLTKLDKDGDLPWGWHTANKEFTEKIEAQYQLLDDDWRKALHHNVYMEREALIQLIQFMESIKDFCDSKDECFSFWASILVANPEILDGRKMRLDYIERNAEKIEAEIAEREEERRKKELEETLTPIVKEKIKLLLTDSPGFLQKDIYDMFTDDDEASVSSLALYQLRRDGLIVREKAGRTFKLYLSDKWK